MNYFELFGLPVAPSVDKSIISKKYHELQKKYHPDFFSHADATEKEEVLQLSAEVNKGYMTFQSADITLSYFLQTIGVLEIGEKYDLPAEFLMDMMDINESFTENETVAINEVKKQEEKLWEEIKPVIQNYSEANRETTNLQKLKEYYYKKKYLQRILDRLAD